MLSLKNSLLPGFIFCICSCVSKSSNEKEDKNDGENKTEKKSTTNVNGANITNNINVQANGVKLARATLVFENGEKVPDDNVVNLGEKISLKLHFDTGWTKINNTSWLGATETIETDNGTKILDAGDLFKDYNESGLDANDSKDISLKAVITETSAGIKYFLVTFRVWDKKGTGEAFGDYKFYVK